MWCQATASDRLGLTSTPWLFLCVTEDTAALFLCPWMVKSAFGFPPTPTPLPPAHLLYTEFVILVEFRKSSQNPAV